MAFAPPSAAERTLTLRLQFTTVPYLVSSLTTLIVMVAETPSAVAVMFALPSLRPVILPVSSTETVSLSLEVHVALL